MVGKDAPSNLETWVGLIFPIMGVLLFVVSPIFEATGFLLGISVLAPIFALAIHRSRTVKSEQTSKTRWDYFRARSAYFTAVFYNLATIGFLVQLFLFITGVQSDTQPLYTDKFFIAGSFFFAVAAIPMTHTAAHAYANLAGSESLTFTKWATLIGILLLYTTRLTLVVSVTRYIPFLDVFLESKHVTTLIGGFLLYLGFMFSCVFPPKSWHFWVAGGSTLIALISILLYPAGVL